MMGERAAVFAEIYRDYLEQLGRAWDGLALPELGLAREGDQVLAPLYGRVYGVSPRGISGPEGRKPSHARCVVLAKYLLAQPRGASLRGQWTSYRGFQDAAPYAASFAQYAEGRIAKAFAGRRPELARAGQALGGSPPGERFSYDLCLQFPALPRVPLLLLFNDQEEGFPASCSLLFDESAPAFLDMECLAMLGLILAESLPEPLAGDEAPDRL